MKMNDRAHIVHEDGSVVAELRDGLLHEMECIGGKLEGHVVLIEYLWKRALYAEQRCNIQLQRNSDLVHKLGLEAGKRVMEVHMDALMSLEDAWEDE